MNSTHVETIIIGGGQAGLVTAYHLQQLGRDCLVLEADERIGDGWRRRFDSLRLFTPAKYDTLPGLRLPMPGSAFPTGNEMADYLEDYAAVHDLPVLTGTRVHELSHNGQLYVLRTESSTYTADAVV